MLRTLKYIIDHNPYKSLFTRKERRALILVYTGLIGGLVLTLIIR